MNIKGLGRFVLSGRGNEELKSKNCPPYLVFYSCSMQLQPHRAWKTTLRDRERIQVKDGQCWITVSGLPDDIILQAGQCWTTPQKTEIVISALRDSPCVLEIHSRNLRFFFPS